MNNRLDDFLQQAQQLMKRLGPLLPPEPAAIDWSTCQAARWQQVGRFGQLIERQFVADFG